MTLKFKPSLLLFAVLAMFIVSCEDDISKDDISKDPKPDSEEEMVMTPWGPYPKSLTFLVEDGFTTKEENNQLLKVEIASGKVVKVLLEDVNREELNQPLK